MLQNADLAGIACSIATIARPRPKLDVIYGGTYGPRLNFTPLICMFFACAKPVLSAWILAQPSAKCGGRICLLTPAADARNNLVI